MFDLLSVDNFFPDVEGLRRDVLAKGFATINNPADGLDYQGIQVRDPEEFRQPLAELVGFDVKIQVAIMRIAYKGELLENLIHADGNMGEFAAVGYLTPKGAPVTGTAFWTDKATGLEELPTKEFLDHYGIAEKDFVARIQSQANDQSKWVNSGFIAARPGRLITYPTKRFHSRFPFTGFGETPETARLILAVFYDRA